jgi:6-phosphogluconolactonase (cycloisomerase 2 family)
MLLAPTLLSAQNSLNLFIGGYGPADEDGIKWYTFNQETGEYQYITAVSGIQNPSFQTLSTDGNILYSVSENSADAAQLVSLRIDRDAHSLTRIATAPTFGDDPCHVWVDNNTAITANYTGGSITTFSIDNHGNIARDTTIQYVGGYPGDERQDKAHLHFIYPSPDGKYIYADDLGSDKIYKFTVTGGKIDFTHQQAINVTKGVGPRHAVFHPNGKFLYIIGELSGSIEVFDYNSTNGDLTPKQSVQVDPLFARGSGDIRISPDGRYIYGSNRLQGDGIATLAVDPGSGILRNMVYQYTGAHPRNFIITPNGKYLLCACRDTNTVQIFARDARTGLLTDTHTTIPTPRPSCLTLTK